MRVAEAIAGLLAMTAAEKLKRAETAKRKEVERRAALVQAAKERKKARVRERDERVLQSLQNWRTARELREYIADARRIAGAADRSVHSRSETGRFIRWAAILAMRLDPFERLRKDVAEHIEDLQTRIGPGCEPEENRNHARAEQDLIEELRGFIANAREAQEIRAHVAACTAVLDGRPLQFEGGETAAEWL